MLVVVGGGAVVVDVDGVEVDVEDVDVDAGDGEVDDVVLPLRSASGGGTRPFERAAAVSHASGPLLLIGLGGLALLAALAEGDRRMMRGAHKRLAFESQE